jgi:hypothetical protein
LDGLVTGAVRRDQPSTPAVERALATRRAGGKGEMLVWRALRAAD